MGTLRYGSDSYTVANEDLVTLQFPIWEAIREDTSFLLELNEGGRTIILPISRGVPVSLIIDTAEPLHRGDEFIDGWTAEAKRGGIIPIPS